MPRRFHHMLPAHTQEQLSFGLQGFFQRKILGLSGYRILCLHRAIKHLTDAKEDRALVHQMVCRERGFRISRFSQNCTRKCREEHCLLCIGLPLCQYKNHYGTPGAAAENSTLHNLFLSLHSHLVIKMNDAASFPGPENGSQTHWVLCVSSASFWQPVWFSRQETNRSALPLPAPV